MTHPKIHLAAGGHSSPDEGGCVMEWVSLLAKQRWTDHPTCTNAVITRAAQAVNDRLNDAERQRLVALIPRIMRARRTDSDRRVNVRLALWAARSVLHLTGEGREASERAIRAVEAWLAGEANKGDLVASAAAYASSAAAYASAAAAASAAYAAYAYAAAAASAAYAAYASAAYAAAAAADPVAWLDSLLDAWEKAVNEEGEALWVPTEWEDEALAFLDELSDAPR